MKFRVDRKDFQEKAAIVASVVPGKPIVTTIANMMIEAGNEKIRMSASDFEVTIQSKMDAEIEKKGVAIVNAKTLITLIKRLPQQPLEFEVKKNDLYIRCGKGEYTLPTVSKDDYVYINGIENKTLIDVNPTIFSDIIEKTLFAVSNDSVKIAITGLYMEANKKDLTCVATDGHRMAKYDAKNIFKENIKASVIVPSKILTTINKIIDKVSVFKMGFDEKRIMFQAEDVEISALLLEGNYPDYKAVIPTTNDKTLELSAESFIDVLDRVSIFTNDITRLIKLNIHPEKMIISAYNSLKGTSQEKIGVQFHGAEGLEIGFNYNLVVDILKKMPKSNLIISLKGETSAVLIQDKEVENVMYLIMPLRLKV